MLMLSSSLLTEQLFDAALGEVALGQPCLLVGDAHQNP